jgi:hypothetical protein
MELSRTLPDATTLAREHREGQRDPRATVRSTLQRVHALQESLNAFAAMDDEGANARAAELADAIACGEDTGLLAGVPVCVKDILDVAGLPTRWGSLLMAQAPPAKSDIAAVARLRAAGAVVIGKTTTTEFAHSPLGFSPLTGLTRNPWAPELTCAQAPGWLPQPDCRPSRLRPMPAAPPGCPRLVLVFSGSNLRSARRRTIACPRPSQISFIWDCWRGR